MATPSSPKILLVDDTDANRYAMSRLLRKEGFLVIEAASGREALQLAAAQPQPDLIVLDVRLPDLSGFEICAQLKEHPATMATPVLQLSAVYVRDEDKVQGLQSGADSYLTEPSRASRAAGHGTGATAGAPDRSCASRAGRTATPRARRGPDGYVGLGSADRHDHVVYQFRIGGRPQPRRLWRHVRGLLKDGSSQ